MSNRLVAETSAPASKTPVSVERQPTLWTIRLHRGFDLGSVSSLQAALLEGLASGVSLAVDLQSCGLSVPIVQLLHAAQNEATKRDLKVRAIASKELAEDLPFTGFSEDMWQTVSSANHLPVTKEA